MSYRSKKTRNGCGVNRRASICDISKYAKSVLIILAAVVLITLFIYSYSSTMYYSIACLESANSRYNGAILHGSRSIPYAVEFSRLFPAATNSISHWSGAAGGPSCWRSDAEVRQRGRLFRVALQIDIDMNACRNKIVKYNNMIVAISEINKRVYKEGGVSQVIYGHGVVVNKDAWRRLVDNKGDIIMTFAEFDMSE